MELYVEIRDTGTTDYWTRVNYTTIVPPGKSTLIVPIKQLYVGEKSRPGGLLDLAQHHAPGLRHRRQAAGAAVRRQRPPGARRRGREGRRSTGSTPSTSARQHLPGAWRASRRSSRPRVYTEGRGLRPEERRRSRARSTRSSPTRSTRTSSASTRAAWPSTCPTASTASVVNIDSPSGSGASTRVQQARHPRRGHSPSSTTRMDEQSRKKQYFRFWNVDDLPDRQHLRQVPEGLLPREDVRRGRDRRAAHRRVPGRERGVRRVGRGHLPRRQGGRGREVPQVRRGPPAVPLRQLLQARRCTARRAIRSPRRPPTRRAASSSSPATS